MSNKKKTPEELKDVAVGVLAGLITWGVIELLKELAKLLK